MASAASDVNTKVRGRGSAKRGRGGRRAGTPRSHGNDNRHGNQSSADGQPDASSSTSSNRARGITASSRGRPRGTSHRHPPRRKLQQAKAQPLAERDEIPYAQLSDLDFCDSAVDSLTWDDVSQPVYDPFSDAKFDGITSSNRERMTTSSGRGRPHGSSRRRPPKHKSQQEKTQPLPEREEITCLQLSDLDFCDSAVDSLTLDDVIQPVHDPFSSAQFDGTTSSNCARITTSSGRGRPQRSSRKRPPMHESQQAKAQPLSNQDEVPLAQLSDLDFSGSAVDAQTWDGVRQSTHGPYAGAQFAGTIPYPSGPGQVVQSAHYPMAGQYIHPGAMQRPAYPGRLGNVQVVASFKERLSGQQQANGAAPPLAAPGMSTSDARNNLSPELSLHTWHYGQIAKCLSAQRCGFVKVDSSGSTGAATKDVFFHYDRAAFYGMEISAGDRVQFMLKPPKKQEPQQGEQSQDKHQQQRQQKEPNRREQKEKKKPEASRLRLVKFGEQPPHYELEAWLEKSREEALSPGNNAELLRCLEALPVWQAIFNCSAESLSTWTETVLNFVLDLRAHGDGHRESFCNLAKAIVRTNFFRHTTGQLVKYMQLEQNGIPVNVDLVCQFLLTLIRSSRNLVRPLFPLLRKLQQMDWEDSSFLNSFYVDVIDEVASIGNTGTDSTVEWNELPLVPTATELLGPATSSLEWTPLGGDMPESIPVVRRRGPYDSATHYLDTYFRLLREDCFASLRDGVRKLLRHCLDARDMNVYKDVRLAGYEVKDEVRGDGGDRGLRLALTVKALNPKIDWAKRPGRNLMYGNLVCISTNGRFDRPLWATVASRDLMATKGIVLVESCGDFEGSDVGDLVAHMRYANQHGAVMVETPTYYKAFQPILHTLQGITPETLPFREELVQVDYASAQPAEFLENVDEATVDITCLRSAGAAAKQPEHPAENPDPADNRLSITEVLAMLADPEADLCLDEGQRSAISHVLTHRLATVQGPPGTGKTYIGVKLVQLLLSLSELPSNSSVLVLTYKNHALDEFLLACTKFASVVRVGGRCDDPKLSQVNLRSMSKAKRCPSYYEARSSLKVSYDDLQSAARTLAGATRFSVECFLQCATPLQVKNLIFGMAKQDWGSGRRYLCLNQILPHCELEEWVATVDRDVLTELVQFALGRWLPDQTVFAALHPEVKPSSTLLAPSYAPESMARLIGLDGGSDSEDEDEAQRTEIERQADFIRAKPKEKKIKIEPLFTEPSSKQDWWPEQIVGIQLEVAAAAQDIARHDNDMWSLDSQQRALFVQYLISQQMELAHKALMDAVEECNSDARRLEEINATETAEQLRERSYVIGMTVTGASIKHELLKSIKPPIVIIEEAAEVLEPQVVAALGPWVKHLIMIGDHKQLRPQVASYPLKREHFFDVSMMERLMNNNIDHSKLLTQNRMRPEFSQLLRDIYPDLLDRHSIVDNLVAPRCMADSMFFWHTESKETAERSVTNREEAERATWLALWFVQQGYAPTQVTVLAPYQGQARLLRRLLTERLKQVFQLADHPDLWPRKTEATDGVDSDSGEEQQRQQVQSKPSVPEFQPPAVQVHTVDRYQGDENEVVIVSLTRSNKEGNIGFFREVNRRCVAQSRAKCGLYFIGNRNMFQDQPTWSFLMDSMSRQNLIGPELSVTCQRHPDKRISARDAQEIPVNKRNFCTEPCPEEMPCGIHVCDRTCQPWHPHKVCRNEVDVTPPDCGHAGVKECHVPLCDYRCQKKIHFHCPGEQCTKLYTLICWLGDSDDIASRCTERVMVELSCGHVNKKICKESKAEVACSWPCQKILEACQHPCSAKCGQPCDSEPCKECEKIRERRMQEKIKEINSLVWEMEERRQQQVDNAGKEAAELVIQPDDAADRRIREQTTDLFQKKTDQLHEPQIKNVREIRNQEHQLAQCRSRLQLQGVLEESQQLLVNLDDDKKIRSIAQNGLKGMCTTCVFPYNQQRLKVWSVHTQQTVDLSAASHGRSNFLLWCDVYLGVTTTFEECPQFPGQKERNFDSFFLSAKCTKPPVGLAPGTYCLLDHALIRPRFVVEYVCTAPVSALRTRLEKEAVLANMSKSLFVFPTRRARVGDEQFVLSTATGMFLSRAQKHRGATVTKVTYYVEPELVKRFADCQSRFRQKYPDPSLQHSSPVWAFHTTDVGNIESIMKNNFDLGRSGAATSHSGKFGRGIYFSEHVDHSLRYGGKDKALLLCYLLPGKEYSCTSVEPGRGLEKGFDSHCYAPDEDGYGKELCIFDPDQILPAFHIEYTDRGQRKRIAHLLVG